MTYWLILIKGVILMTKFAFSWLAWLPLLFVCFEFYNRNFAWDCIILLLWLWTFITYMVIIICQVFWCLSMFEENIRLACLMCCDVWQPQKEFYKASFKTYEIMLTWLHKHAKVWNLNSLFPSSNFNILVYPSTCRRIVSTSNSRDVG